MYKLRFLLWYESKLHLSVPYLVHIFLVRELIALIMKWHVRDVQNGNQRAPF